MLANRLRVPKRGLDQYTKILLHMNGADGSTNFEDETGRIWTPGSPAAQISTFTSVFGGASGSFSYGSISTPHHSDLVLSSVPFTIDFWIRIPDQTNNYQVFSKSPNRCVIETGWVCFYVYGSSASSRTCAMSGKLTPHTWYHVGILRDGNNLIWYKNGIYIKTDNIYGYDFWDNGSAFMFSKSYCYIDEFRLSKGILRWNSNFTPPTEEY
jgi:hypothetical protein